MTQLLEQNVVESDPDEGLFDVLMNLGHEALTPFVVNPISTEPAPASQIISRDEVQVLPDDTAARYLAIAEHRTILHVQLPGQDETASLAATPYEKRERYYQKRFEAAIRNGFMASERFRTLPPILQDRLPNFTYDQILKLTDADESFSEAIAEIAAEYHERFAALQQRNQEDRSQSDRRHYTGRHRYDAHFHSKLRAEQGTAPAPKLYRRIGQALLTPVLPNQAGKHRS